MNNEPPYVSDLFDALEDLMNKVHNHCPVIPDGVKSSLDFAYYVLARVRFERAKQ